MTVHGSDQGAVRPFIDRRPGMGQPQQAGAEQREYRAADRPVHGQGIRMRGPRATHGRIGIDGHADEGDRFERAEEAADRQPVAGYARPVVMMGGPENAGHEHQTDDDIQPLLYQAAIRQGDTVLQQ